MANGKGIAINFLADVRDFLRGTKNVEDELDDVADALDDVARDGEQASEKLEDGFKEVLKASKKTGDGIGDNFKKGTKEAGEGLDDLQENSKSNAKEVAASFDGSVESIVDGFQGLAAEAFEGFGVAGLVAGAALAAGIGLATAEFQRTEEEAQKARERIAELGLAMIEAGAEGERPLESVIEALQGIITNSDDAVKKFKDIDRAVQFVGGSAEELALAYAGSEKALENQLDVTEKLLKEAEKESELLSENASRFGTVSEAKVQSLQKQQEELQKVQEETERAAEIEQTWLASGGAEFLAKQEAINQIDAAYDDAVYGIDNFLNAETGIYDLDAFAQSIRDREQLLLDYQNLLAESGLTTEQKAALNEYGVEQAAAILKGLKDPNVSQQTKDTIKKGLGEASKEGSGVAQKELQNAFKDPVQAKIEAIAETAAAEKALENVIRERSAKIKIDFIDARTGKRVN
jgi:hypothetical protein